MKHIKNLLSVFLCLCLVFGLLTAAAADDGAISDTGAEPELAETGVTMNVGQTKWIYLDFNEPRAAVNSAIWESNSPWEVEIIEQNSIGCQVRINEYISYQAIISCTYYYTQYDRDYKYHHFLSGYKSFYISVNEPVKYTVSFDAEGGSVSPSSKTVYSGSTIGDLPTPRRSGYIFQGWYTSDGVRVSSSTVVSRNMTVYADWLKDVTYTVKFNANGGTVSPASASVHNGSSIGSIPTPVRSGYAFDGWYTAASGGTQVTSSTKVSSNMTVYAHWVTGIKITFDPAGGAVSPTYAEIKKGGSIGSLPAPTKENYFFNGWYTAKSGGTQVTSSTTFSAKTTIYAQWIPGIIITFRPEGGKVTPASAVIKPGTSIGALPEPTRSGYAFGGWYTAASGGDKVTPSTSFELNTKIFAHWKEYIKITLDPNGGTVPQKELTVISGEKIGTLPEPERADWYFDGWYTAASGGNKITSDSVCTKSAKLYTHWIKGIVISLIPMGGTVSTNRVTVRPGSSVGYLPSAQRDGYSFSGWVTADSDAEVSGSAVFYNDTALYAVWEKTVGDFRFIISRSKATLKYYGGKDTVVTIPSKVDNCAVTKIGKNAFHNTKVRTVTVPEGVTEIDEYAFFDCIDLYRVNLPNSIEKLGKCAFSQSYVKYRPISVINFPANIKYVGLSAMRGTAWYDSQPNGPIYIGKVLYEYKGGAPANVTLRSDTTGIAGNAFKESTNLRSITLPESVTYLGKDAFYHCSNLTSINLPKKLTEIGEEAFCGCNSLAGITLPAGIKRIEPYAFHNCTSFKSITIPDGVTSIDSQSFYGCTNLKTITIPASVTYIAYRSLGYYAANNTSVTVDGFTIRGYEYTEAQSYAEDSGFKFVIIGQKANKVPMGDLNGDSEVNNRDAMLFDRYISGWGGYENKLSRKLAADMNRDGQLTNRDAMILDRCVAGWTGYDKYTAAVTFVGDLNNDGMVNNRDAVIFDRYIPDPEGYKSMIYNRDAADLNRDGTLTNRDAMILDRYVAGWAGYEKYIITV